MKKVILILFVVFLSSCFHSPKPDRILVENDGTKLEILVFDSCEYIFFKNDNLYGQTLAHKGNCCFCEERLNKKLEKLVKY